jgi:gliding motility-associated-like protein
VKKTILLLSILFITFLLANAQQSLHRSAPFTFIENRGQIGESCEIAETQVLFMLRSPGMKLYISANSMNYRFGRIKNYVQENISGRVNQAGSEMNSSPAVYETSSINVKLLGANTHPAVRKEEVQDYYENYYNVPSHPEGITGVKTCGRIVLENVYPFIDWILYVKNNRLKYDFVVRPGGKISDIKIEYKGAKEMFIDQDGSLFINTLLGEIREEKPVSFQDGQKVSSNYILQKTGNLFHLSFAIEKYSSSKTLIIDPDLIWATYYGGTNGAQGNSTATDNLGNVYLAGTTWSTDHISHLGHQNSNGQNPNWNLVEDAFLVKFNSVGKCLWATYYGGEDEDEAFSVCTDLFGNVYIAGATMSTNNIANQGYQISKYGTRDAFLVKFNSFGTRQWGTYYGAEGGSLGLSVCSDLNGNVYLAGTMHGVNNNNFSKSGHQNLYGGGNDAYLVKFNTHGQRQWCTYYGGSGDETGQSVCSDKSGNIFLAGGTSSSNNISNGGHQDTFGGGNYGDAFLVKFNGNGIRQWSTYYGGVENEGLYSAAVCTDPLDNIYLTSTTTSKSKISWGGYQDIPGGNNDAFLVKFDPDGIRQWATYFGGTEGEQANSISSDLNGNIYLAGATGSSCRITHMGYQELLRGNGDAYIARFNSEGKLNWSTYYGGSQWEIGESICVDIFGNIYLAGITWSPDFISKNGHQDSAYYSFNAFLAKFDTIETNNIMLSKPVTDKAVYCHGDSAILSFSAFSNFNPGNTFLLEMSDVNGDFSNSVLIDSINDESSDCYSMTLRFAAGTSIGNNYRFRIISTEWNDTSMLSDPVSLKAAPPDSLTFTGNYSPCNGDSLVIYAPAGFSYLWQHDNINTSDTSQQIVVKTEGIYRVKITNSYGCSIFSQDTTLFSDIPMAHFIISPNPLCMRETAIFTTSTGLPAFIEFGDGDTASFKENITHVYASAGKFYPKLYVDSANCTGFFMDSSGVMVHQEPEVDFLFSPDVISRGEAVSFVANNTWASYHWNFGNLQIATNQYPVIRYSDTGDFQVTLLVYNDFHCKDSISKWMNVAPAFVIFIPNTFTPNDDGLNDLFFPQGEGILQYRMRIYNRWGQQIFTGTQSPWNGKVPASRQGLDDIPVQEGSYMYQISITDNKNRTHSLQGLVYILK